MISSNIVLKQVFAKVSAGAQGNIGKSDFDNLRIPLPSISEQEKISEILSTLDDKINVINNQIADTAILKKSLMQRLFSKGIGHIEFKSSELGEIPESWRTENLSETGVFGKGKGISKAELVESGNPCIRYGEIYTIHHFIIKEYQSFIADDTAANSVLLKTGDILFAASGETVEDIGKAVAFLGNDEVYAGGDIIIFSPCELNSTYLAYFLNSDIILSQRRKYGQGNSVVHISASNLGKLKIAIPPIAEQIKIAEILTTVESKIEALHTKRVAYQDLKTGLMQQLLTGKIRVNTYQQESAVA